MRLKENHADTRLSEVKAVNQEKGRAGSIRFGSYVWSVNPSELMVTRKGVVSSEINKEVFKIDKAQVTVSGKGCFFGTGAMDKFIDLQKITDEGRKEVLYYPGGRIFNASLTELKLLGKPGAEKAEYSFSFSGKPEEDILARESLTAAGGESLWDISNIYGIPIEKLVSLNRHIRDINYLNKGDTICLK